MPYWLLFLHVPLIDFEHAFLAHARLLDERQSTLQLTQVIASIAACRLTGRAVLRKVLLARQDTLIEGLHTVIQQSAVQLAEYSQPRFEAV